MSVRYLSVLCVVFSVISMNLPATAQDRPDDYRRALMADCGNELKGLCNGIQDGRGRLLACLYAHENKLSAKCGETVAVSLERLGEALGALANVLRVCDQDVKRLCHGVAAGNGSLVGCLTAARASVSPACNATMDSAFLRP